MIYKPQFESTHSKRSRILFSVSTGDLESVASTCNPISIVNTLTISRQFSNCLKKQVFIYIIGAIIKHFPLRVIK